MVKNDQLRGDSFCRIHKGQSRTTGGTSTTHAFL
jgi:hypothetical protein